MYILKTIRVWQSSFQKRYSSASLYGTVKQTLAECLNHPNLRQHTIYFKWSAVFQMPLQIRLEIIQFERKQPTNLPSVWYFYLILGNLNNLMLFTSQLNLCFLDIQLELLSIYLRIFDVLREGFLSAQQAEAAVPQRL